MRVLRQWIRLIEQVGPLLNNSHKLCGGAKASLVSFAPENVDVDWIVSETDEYESRADRKLTCEYGLKSSSLS